MNQTNPLTSCCLAPAENFSAIIVVLFYNQFSTHFNKACLTLFPPPYLLAVYFPRQPRSMRPAGGDGRRRRLLPVLPDGWE